MNFATCLNCIDGRIQILVLTWITGNYGYGYVDLITEPGIAGRLAHHVVMADTAYHIGDAPPGDSYLNIDKIIRAALQANADAVHPGWGFLAENDLFARRVEEAGR